ncbi:uncharacterized protein LOC127807921 isoform X2 [Diospyros lotus]|uniref:uncharacterized protein LOC127807921 isoform X2 n=1 Tax=Diospyros lotus TaxID=55363 RepID=UPI002256C201|nr:uncharacterized protein LOC127807921 isoform X2 [Diospyros lotus]
MPTRTLFIRIKILGSIEIEISGRAVAMFLLKAWRSTAFGAYGYLNFTRAGYLEHSKKFNPDDMQASISGKNCIVTGANSGIGYATAEGLASRGANVFMVCRNKERGEAACSQIQSVTVCRYVIFHLSMRSSHLLPDFLQRIFQFMSWSTMLAYLRINVLPLLKGPFTMTEIMLPLLEKAAPDARVITVSSGGMYTAPLMEDLQFSSGKFDGVEQYARNKRVQVALTEKWAELYKDKGIGFYSMHPGWAETPGVARSLPGFSKSFSGKLRTSEQGADTLIWLALQAKDKLVSGAFYFDRAEAPKHLPFAATGGSHVAIDPIIKNLHYLSSLPS